VRCVGELPGRPQSASAKGAAQMHRSCDEQNTPPSGLMHGSVADDTSPQQQFTIVMDRYFDIIVSVVVDC